MAQFVGATAKLLPQAAKINRSKRPDSLFDVLFGFKNYGVGQNVFRARWRKYWTKRDVPDCYVTITRVKVKRRVRKFEHFSAGQDPVGFGSRLYWSFLTVIALLFFS